MMNLANDAAQPNPGGLVWGRQACRLHVQWQRVRPGGSGAWCREGMAFYDRLADRLQARGLQVHLCLQPWQLPQDLRLGGGWSRRDTAQRFVEFALGVGGLLGDRAASIASQLQAVPSALPGQAAAAPAGDACSRALALQAHHHLLHGHGLAVQALRADACRSRIGAVLDIDPIAPLAGTRQQVRPARRGDAQWPRWTLSALFKGEYPADELAQVAGLAPEVMPGDFADMRVPMDFFGIRHGTERQAKARADLLAALRRSYPLPDFCVTEAAASRPAPWHATLPAHPRHSPPGARAARGDVRLGAPLQTQAATATGV